MRSVSPSHASGQRVRSRALYRAPAPSQHRPRCPVRGRGHAAPALPPHFTSYTPVEVSFALTTCYALVLHTLWAFGGRRLRFLLSPLWLFAPLFTSYAALLVASWQPDTLALMLPGSLKEGLATGAPQFFPTLDSIMTLLARRTTAASAWAHLLVVNAFVARHAFLDGARSLRRNALQREQNANTLPVVRVYSTREAHAACVSAQEQGRVCRTLIQLCWRWWPVRWASPHTSSRGPSSCGCGGGEKRRAAALPQQRLPLPQLLLR